MTTDATAPLAEGFPAPDRAAWLAQVVRSLKGAPFESLVSRTADGLEISPLYTADDANGRLLPRTDTGGEAAWDVRALAAAATPAEAGADDANGRLLPRTDTGGEAAWDVRALAAAATPAEAGADAIEDLEGGAASVLLRLDPNGARGCAIGSAEDLAQALDGVVLEAATVALDAGWLGVAAAGWLDQVAKGSPAARLAFHLDPIGAFAAEGRSPGPVGDHISGAAAAGVRLAARYPLASLFLASGLAAHEAGGSEAQELALMAAAAATYARALADQGLAPADALPRIVAAVAVDGDYFVSIAKLRAARLVLQRIWRASGADASTVRIEARSSGRMLSRVDAWTNLLRLTASAFAGAAGGADAVVLTPFTDALGSPTPLARRQARNIQLLLMQESHAGRVQDPGAGSWFIESLTERMAREAWAAFQAIERAGGAVAALESGLIAANVEGARAALLAAAEARGILGVTRFPNPDERPAPTARRAAVTPVEVDVALPGADSTCSALEQMRISAGFEDPDGALT